eukprot:633985_1
MTFCLKSWKQDCIDKVETQSLSNLYANKKKSPEEWRKYFITETNPIAALLFRLEVSQYASIFKENGYDTIQQLQGLTSMDLSNIGVDVDAHGQAILNGIAAHLNRVTTFLSHLGFDRYTPIFKENECETMDDLEELTNDDLKDMGVKAYAHRKKIIKGIAAHFSVKSGSNSIQNKQESKQKIDTKTKLPETGVLQWNITGDLLRQFKNAKHKEEFVSPDFKTEDGTIWRVQFYPRGKTSSEQCSVFLLCATLSANKARIGVNYSFNIIDDIWINDSAETFIKDGDTWGKNEAFKSAKLDDLSTLHIQCVVEETMDVADGNEFFEWTISNYMLQKWRNAKQKDKFYSPSFNAIGAEWHFRVIPNGWTTEGIAELDLQCKSIESDEKEMNVCHYADIVELNYCDIHLGGTTTKKGDWFELKSPFKLNDIENRSKMTFCLKSWKQECIDKEEVQSLSHLYAKKKKSPKEWREYFITDTNPIPKLLFRLELPQYAATFKENGYDTIQQLKDLKGVDLSKIDVDVDAHGKAILNGIAAHLNRVTTFLSHLGFDQYTP